MQLNNSLIQSVIFKTFFVRGADRVILYCDCDCMILLLRVFSEVLQTTMMWTEVGSQDLVLFNIKLYGVKRQDQTYVREGCFDIIHGPKPQLLLGLCGVLG